MSAMPGMPPGMPPDQTDPGALAGAPDPAGGPGAPGPAGAPQFPSADPQAIMALLSQLIAGDQQALGQAQVAAVGGAFAQLLQSQPDPNAAAAASGPPPVTGPAPAAAGVSPY